MASSQDIEKLRRNVSETWEEAFRGVDKTSEEFDNLVQEFTKFVGEWKDFSEIRRDRLADYLTDLDDVSKHWKEINRWVEENTDAAEVYVGSLSEIRRIFQEIAGDLGGVRRQTTDNVGLVRSLSRLAGDNIIALKQEGGLTENVVKSLSRKSLKLQEEYNTRLRIIGVKEDRSNIGEIRERVEWEKENALIKVRSLEAQKKAAGFLTSLEREQLRNAQRDLELATSKLELLNEYNLQVASGLHRKIELEQEAYQVQRRGTKEAGPNALGASRVEFLSKLMSKFGMAEEGRELSRDYGEWVTKRIDASANKDLTKEALEAAKKNYDNAVADEGSEAFLKRKTELDSKIAELTAAAQSAEIKLGDTLGQKEEARSFADRFKLDKRIGGYRDLTTGRIATAEQLEEYNEAIKKYDDLEKAEKRLTKQIQKRKAELAEIREKYDSELGGKVEALDRLTEAEKAAKEASESYDAVTSTKFHLWSRVGSTIKGAINPTRLLGLATTAFVSALLSGFVKVDSLSSNLKQRIGSWETGLAAINTQFASAADCLQTATELTDAWHINPVTVFTGEEIGRMAEAKNLLGLTAQQAQALGIYSKMNNKTSDEYMKSMNRGFQSYNRTHRTAIAYGNVQREVLGTSESIRLSYGGQGEALARAANAALSIGMTMQQVEGVMNNLIQFESSIEAEMQAQLLTGKQLNLAKAREYALNNDIEGTVKEINKQGINAAWWGSANRIQQENMAKALGMSREEMAKMLVTQQLQNGASAAAIAANMKITEQEVKQMSALDTWKKTLEKAAQSFAPLVRLLGVVFDLLSLIIQPIASVVGYVMSLGGLIDRLTESTSRWANIARTAIGTFALSKFFLGRGLGIFTNLFRISTLGFRGIITGAGKASTALMPLLLRTGKIGANIKEWATSAAAAESGALKRFVGNKLLGNVKVGGKYRSPEVLERARRIKASQIPSEAAEGSSKLGKSFSSLGENMGTILKGAAAMLLISGALWVTAKACQEFAKTNWEDLGKAAAALGGLTAAVLIAGNLISKGGKALLQASVYVIAFGGAIALVAMGIGEALKLMAPFVNAITGLVAAVLVGLKEVLDVLTPEKMKVFPLLGLGFYTLAIGLTSAIIPLSLFPIKRLENLVNAFTPLKGVDLTLVGIGTAIGTIAENLGKLDPKKLQSLSDLSALRIRPEVEVGTKQNLRESEGIQQENISATAQEIVIKQAEVQANSQQISIEQKAADLSRIEQKMDELGRIIKKSQPDWNWLEFGNEMGRQIPWIFSQA